MKAKRKQCKNSYCKKMAKLPETICESCQYRKKTNTQQRKQSRVRFYNRKIELLQTAVDLAEEKNGLMTSKATITKIKEDCEYYSAVNDYKYPVKITCIDRESEVIILEGYGALDRWSFMPFVIVEKN